MAQPGGDDPRLPDEERIERRRPGGGWRVFVSRPSGVAVVPSAAGGCLFSRCAPAGPAPGAAAAPGSRWRWKLLQRRLGSSAPRSVTPLPSLGEGRDSAGVPVIRALSGLMRGGGSDAAEEGEGAAGRHEPGARRARDPASLRGGRDDGLLTTGIHDVSSLSRLRRVSGGPGSSSTEQDHRDYRTSRARANLSVATPAAFRSPEPAHRKPRQAACTAQHGRPTRPGLPVRSPRS